LAAPAERNEGWDARSLGATFILNIMVHQKIIIMVFFLSTLFGCKEIQKKESFSVIESTLNGNPVIGSFNMAYIDFNQKSEYPWCLTISIALDQKNLNPNKLPLPNETKIANDEEDQLVSKIEKIAKVKYVGHLFNDSFLDVYIYLDSPEKVHEYLQIEKDKESLIRGIAYEIKQDPNWEIVNGFLTTK
jgi:hypothetical protein